MAPVRARKRKSDQTSEEDASNMVSQKVPIKTGSPSHAGDEGSPAKKRKIGITIPQKQALIDNLQLEITERARKLRAQYNLQAQSLRTRIEIRVNRIPTSLRNTKMQDLLHKYSNHQQPRPQAAVAASYRPPPVPAKDTAPTQPAVHRKPVASARPQSPATHARRISDELSATDKENEGSQAADPKHKLRGVPTAELSHPNPAQILSPTTSNSRLPPREKPAPASPAKSYIARPASPVKTGSASNLLSSMVEKARSTRAAATTTRKTTASSTASSSNGSAPAAAATRGRRGAATAVPAPTRAAGAAGTTRTARRVSGTSESSDGSTSTVVKKRTAAAAGTTRAPAAAATTKRTVMSTIKKGVTGGTTRKPVAPKAAPTPAPATTGRVLRRRN